MTEKIKYLDLEGGSKDEKRRWVVAINGTFLLILDTTWIIAHLIYI